MGIRIVMLLMPVLLCCCCSAFGADAETTVSPVGAVDTATKYTISVANVADAAAIDLFMSYDMTMLTPQAQEITDGKFVTDVGASKMVNANTPGTLRIMYFVTTGATMNGGGILATVKFNRIAKGKNAILRVAADLYDINGKKVGNKGVVETGKDQQKTDDTTGQGKDGTTPPPTTQQPQPNPTAAVTGVIAGVVTDPASQTPAAQRPKGEEPGAAASHGDGASQQPASGGEPRESDAGEPPRPDTALKAAPEKPAAAALEKIKGLDAVVDRFRDYKGARTAKALAGLFSQSEQRELLVLQKPAIAISDGKTPITVRIQLPVTVTPSFSLRGANLKAIRNLTGRSWELDAVPQKGKTDVRITVMTQGESAEIPLSVVPQLDARQEKELLGLGETALDSILGKAGIKGTKPLFDLNADGRQDYLDDYILIGNWLHKRQKAEKDKKAIVEPKKK